jgi:hypothetical protein
VEHTLSLSLWQKRIIGKRITGSEKHSNNKTGRGRYGTRLKSRTISQ